MSRFVAPPKSIAMMEDHDKAYHVWSQQAIRDRTLVHVDAHIDFGWIPEMDLDEIASDGKLTGDSFSEGLLLNPFIKSRKKMINIGNYIWPAMRDGIVKKFYWVVPDPSWRSARGSKHIIKQLKQALRIKKYAGGKLEVHKDYIRCRVFDREVIVCSLEKLERLEDPVLLDIDVDFMLTRSIWDDLNPRRVPWIFPEELYEKLILKTSDVEILTIAYSVEGGFTPLRFKYLGDELRSLFEEKSSLSMRNVIHYKRLALACEKERKRAEACAAYEEALKIDSTDASLYYNLFLLHLDDGPGHAGKAEHFYNEALRRDKTYATNYNNYGILYLRYNKPKDAAVEYKKFLDIDRDSKSVLSGLGYIALTAGRFSQAEEFFDRCLALDKSHPEARTGKGVVSFKTLRLREAGEFFFELKKDLPDDPEVCWWLGRIAQKKGEMSSAIDNYKDAVMRGGEGPLVHMVLAFLYLNKGLYYRALEELKRFLQVLMVSS